VRHVRMLGLSLAAIVVFAAVAASTASAGLPEFGQCVAKEGGKYSNAGCTVSAKKGGTFEWKKASQVAKKGFSGTAGAGVLEGKYVFCTGAEGTDTKYGRKGLPCPAEDHETVLFEKPIKVECESESNHGEISGSQEVKNIAVTFRGCKLLGTSPCSNTANEGEIHVNTLKGKIGFVNKASEEIGLQLEPAKAHGDFASFACDNGQIGTVVGVGDKAEGCAYKETSKCGDDGIIGVQTPVNEMTSHYSQKFAIDEETQENLPNKLEKKPRASLESYVFNEEQPEFSSQWSKAGETITNVTTSEEEGEVKAAK
jgi:hypothetical protein